MPELSIVIPSYNHERYIAQAVDSCLNQTLEDIEVIVVDDGSKDRSPLYLRSISAPLFHLIEQPNAGAHNAINRGLEAASGEYLAILNSDDVYNTERFAKMISAMRNSNSDFACSWLRQIDAHGRPGPIKKGWHNQLPAWLKESHPIDTAEKDAFLKSLTYSNFVSTTSNMVFTRSLHKRIGGMRNLRFAHDWDFAFRACLEAKPLLVEESLVDYRTHETNTIRTDRNWMMFEILWCLAVHLPPTYCKLNMPFAPGKCAPPFEIGENLSLFRDIMDFIREKQINGTESPEDLLLDDPKIREPFVSSIC